MIWICPYKNNDFNKYRNPLKILEYFSYRVPAVMVKCDISKEMSCLVSIAETYDKFMQGIEYELLYDTQKKFQ